MNIKRVLSYGMKHSLAPKHLPTAKILASVKAAISYNDDLSIEVKETIRTKVASTLQTSMKPVNKLTKDEQLALSRLRNDDTTVVMNKTEYHKKMCNLVNDDKTYKRLKKDPSKKLQRNLNEKLYPLHQANILKKQIYSRLYCTVAQTPKLNGMPTIHKVNTPAKIKNVILGEDHELVSLDVKSLFTSVPLELAIESAKEALANYSNELPIPKEEVIDLLTLCLHSTYFQYDGSFYQSKTNEDKKVIAAIPYVKGTSERIARILRPYNILVAHKPLTTLRDVLTKVKDPSPKNSRVGAIYRIACSECPASYVEETGRTLQRRVKEHKRCIANKDTSNRIAVHHMTTNHQMDWEGATCLEFETNFNKRMFLESWHSKSDKNSINISRDMPGAYFSLIRELKQATFLSTRTATGSKLLSL